MTCIQKWEIRYPLLLPLCLLCVIVPVHMQSRTCDTAGSSSTECQRKGGYIQVVDADGTCLKSECFGNDTAGTHRERLANSPQLTPKITRSGTFPNQVGVPFNMTCQAWAMSSKGLIIVRMNAPTKPALPEPVLQRRWFFLRGQTVTEVAVEVILPIELTGNRHRQNVTCTMTFGTSTATSEERARSVVDSLYAFKQTNPVIRGPHEVEAGLSSSWECVTDEVTVDRQTQFRLELYTNPAPPQAPKNEENLQKLAGEDKPLKLKVTKTTKFTVPPSFRPAFFVQCRGENTVLGHDKRVSLPADAVRVKVVTKPNDLSGLFTIVGVSSGLGGFALGVALVIYYCRKKPAAGPKAP